MQSKKIAICGGVGSGKSTCTAYLAKKGYCVINCDELARTVAEREDVLEAVKEVFGQEYVCNGHLERRKLREYCFADAQRLDALNGIFLQAITGLLQDKMRQAEATERIIFVEVSNYSEAIGSLFDEVWLIDAPTETRIRRVMFRDNCSNAQAMAIIDKQILPQNAHRVIVNNGYAEDMIQSIKDILADYM